MKKIDIHIWRRTLQTGVAVLFILLPILNAAGFKFIWGNFLNIHIGSLTFSDPLAVFQVIVKNQYLPTGLLISAGMVLAIAFFLGIVFCSWICPFGLLSELVNRLSCRVWPRESSNIKLQKSGFKVKTMIFCAGFLVFWIFFSSPVLNLMSLPFQYSNIFQYLFIQKHLSAGIWFIGSILLAEFVFHTRLWCRWICPQSVLLAVAKLFNPFRLKIIFEKKRCIGSKIPCPCQKACSLDLDPRRLNGSSEAQCTNCGDCVDACRKTGGALGLRFGPG
ncbi:MAG: 4Fe-4S binding protein [Desulfobacula sp.]|uniref:4Fe-4S binding protein n=1 Tax=Desulfobacula sp. TaxID=2593537 RepID=UPI0025BA245D|nr:4Fe-4S binding protein [Desulfobacula sp.]MCD4719104.1 4Fe-4S binding protein [Desulfobacula sp.]